MDNRPEELDASHIETQSNEDEPMHENGHSEEEKQHQDYIMPSGQDEVTQLYASSVKNASNKKVELEVKNPFIKNESFKKYVVYNIEGNDLHGEFGVVRRYSEFEKVRQIMVIRWPGCYVPAIPPKKAMGNLEKEFIEDRRIQLEIFCRNVAAIKHLYYSQEFQLFVRYRGNIEKVLTKLEIVDYDDVISRFSVAFGHLADKELTQDSVSKIIDFSQFLNKVISMFDGFKKMTKAFVKSKKHFYESLSNMQSCVWAPYEKNVYSYYLDGDESKLVYTNLENEGLMTSGQKIKQTSKEHESVEHMYRMLKQEKRELEGMKEAIAQRDKYENLKKKTESKQKSDTATLQKVLEGKKTLKTLFSKKNKEQNVMKYEQNIAKSTHSIDNITAIVDMMTLILAHDEIEKFKKNKISYYFKILSKASTGEINNLHAALEHWQGVANVQHVKDANAQESNNDSSQ